MFYNPSMKLKTSRCAMATVEKRRRSRSSHSSGAKKLSHIALSYASPTEQIDCTTPASRHRFPKATVVYWEPWSLLMDDRSLRLAGGDCHRHRIAHQIGRHTGRRRPAKTIRRLHASSTTARYNHAAQVRTSVMFGHPELVGALSQEVPGHQVGRGPSLGVPLGRARLEAPACHTLDAHLPRHQARHPFAAHTLSGRPQRRVDPRAAVGLAAIHPLRQNPLLSFASRHTRAEGGRCSQS